MDETEEIEETEVTAAAEEAAAMAAAADTAEAGETGRPAAGKEDIRSVTRLQCLPDWKDSNWEGK